MTTRDQFQAKVEKASTNMERLDGIVNGPATGEGSEVDTDSGTVPTIAKWLADGLAGSVGLYRGLWDASTNMPEILAGEGLQGDYYTVGIGGERDVELPEVEGADPVVWHAGDQIQFIDGGWVRIPAVEVTGRNRGTWDASLNTPEILAGVGLEGDFYVVSVAGERDIEAPADSEDEPLAWREGDQVLFKDGAWIRVASTKADTALANATMQPSSTNAVPRAVYIKAREFLSVDDYNSSLRDDATALALALTSAAEGEDNLPLRFLDSLNIDAPIYMPTGAQITGPYQSADHQFEAAGFSQAQGVLRLASDVSIHGGFSSKIENGRIIRLGMAEPQTNAEAFTAIEAMAGTALRTGGIVGFEVENMQIIGFNRAMDFQNNGRGRIRNVRIDCRNGIRWQGSLDVSDMENVRCWPWLTVGLAAGDTRALWRAGIGFEIGAPAYVTGAIDGTTLTVSAVAAGNDVIGGGVVFDGGVLIAVVTGYGTGTGGTGTYTLDRNCNATFTGSKSGTTLTVTAHSGAAIRPGLQITDSGIPIGTVIGMGTGTGGTGTYILDTSGTTTSTALVGKVSSRALRVRIQNDWSNLTSCFTFGYQTGFQLDEAKHATLLNCASDNEGALLFGAHNTVAQTKIGLNVQGETWNTNVIGHRAAAQGRGILIQPSALGGSPWAPLVTLDSPRTWGNGTYAIHHAYGEMVLNNPSCEGLYGGGVGNIIRIDDAVTSSTINFNGNPARQPTISYQSSVARDKTKINGGGIRVVASASSITALITDKRIRLTGVTGVATIAATYPGHRITLCTNGVDGAAFIIAGGNVYLERGLPMPLLASTDSIDLECDGVSWHEISRSIGSAAVSSVISTITDPLTLDMRQEVLLLNGAGSFGTIVAPQNWSGRTIKFLVNANVTFSHGGSMSLAGGNNFSAKSGDILELTWNGTVWAETYRSSNQVALSITTPVPTAEVGTFNVAPSALIECYDRNDGFVDIQGAILLPAGAAGTPGNPTGGLKVTLPFTSPNVVIARGAEIQTLGHAIQGRMAPGSNQMFLFWDDNTSPIGSSRNFQFQCRYRKT